jgi:hypothetical protein
MILQNSVRPIEAIFFLGSDLDNVYTSVNRVLGMPCFYIRIVNDTNCAIDISFNGDDDHDLLIAGKSLQLYGQTNNQLPGNVANFSWDTFLYFRKGQFQAAPAGLIVITGYTSYKEE